MRLFEVTAEKLKSRQVIFRFTTLARREESLYSKSSYYKDSLCVLFVVLMCGIFMARSKFDLLLKLSIELFAKL